MRKILCETVANVEVAVDKNYVLDEKGYVRFSLQAGPRRIRGAYLYIDDCRRATVIAAEQLQMAKSKKLRSLIQVVRNPARVQIIEVKEGDLRYYYVNLFDVPRQVDTKVLFWTGRSSARSLGQIKLHRNDAYWFWISSPQLNWSGKYEQVVCTLTDPWHTVLFDRHDWYHANGETRTLVGVGATPHVITPSDLSTALMVIGWLEDEK